MNKNLDQDPKIPQDDINAKILLESVKALPQAGSAVIRVVMILNGASVVALLAFIGNILDKVKTLPDFSGVFSSYIIGVFIAGVASYTSSRCQFLFYEKQLNIYIFGVEVPEKFRGRFGNFDFYLNITSSLIITGLVAYILGSYQALTILSESQPAVR